MWSVGHIGSSSSGPGMVLSSDEPIYESKYETLLVLCKLEALEEGVQIIYVQVFFTGSSKLILQ